jgi:two-component SAPR family response regulator
VSFRAVALSQVRASASVPGVDSLTIPGAGRLAGRARTVVAHFFGDFTLQVNGRNVDRWHAGKARDLFQYLLVNRGRVVRRERLFEVLWPGNEWSPTASSLKVAIHSLRRILGDAVTPLVEIVSRDQGYLLSTHDIWLDIDEFEMSMATGRSAEAHGDNTVALSAYRRVADLYTGDFLAAQTADWVDEQRQCYRAFALQALTWLRADALRGDDHAKIIDLCRRILDIDPYHEEMYQTLMTVHGRRGELGQVREWHRMCVRRLRRDLDLAPAEATQLIFTRAVHGELRSVPLTHPS